MTPKYTGAKIYNRLHHCQTKFWFKISRCKSIQRNDCRERPLFSKCKNLILHGKNKTTESRKNITDGASELLSSPVTDLEWPRRFQKVKVPRFHDNGTGRW